MRPAVTLKGPLVDVIVLAAVHFHPVSYHRDGLHQHVVVHQTLDEGGHIRMVTGAAQLVEMLFGVGPALGRKADEAHVLPLDIVGVFRTEADFQQAAVLVDEGLGIHERIAETLHPQGLPAGIVGDGDGLHGIGQRQDVVGRVQGVGMADDDAVLVLGQGHVDPGGHAAQAGQQAAVQPVRILHGFKAVGRQPER